ncbi:Thioredoxin domain-containing protein [Mycena indigotica]|uniref:Thioredoxin domain-containing protein n=1 Tax=Mycena indigotica TaxID=2126181 RepID=A0A8H6VYY7_9AGAR|nr:Thioredoxin domain-containing protein [Mycena indigotica]KAF7295413.1 Thioredoxin domain-containing protein [Mycena indigotica]
MATPNMLPLRGHALRRLFQRTPASIAGLHSSSRCRERYINGSKTDFDKIVLQSSTDRVVLVDFHADWCGPCHALSPILNKLTTERTTGSGKPLDLITVDIDNEEAGGVALAQEYKVRAIPTVVAFQGGKPLSQFVGALNEGGVADFLNKL